MAALVLLGEETGTLSRAALMKELSLKEGPIKTLLRRLEQNRLAVSVGNKGHVLTDEGKQWNRKIREKVVDHKQVSASGISLAESAYGIQLRGMSAHVESGIEQRDRALLVGAIGATTLVYERGSLTVPSVSGRVLDKRVLGELVSKFRLQEGDTLIVGMGHNASDAQRGAFNAALSLLLRLNQK